jgi:hypothetical protein
MSEETEEVTAIATAGETESGVVQGLPITDNVATMTNKTHTHPAENTERVSAKIAMAVVEVVEIEDRIETGIETVVREDETMIGGLRDGVKGKISSTIDEVALAAADAMTTEEVAVTSSLSRRVEAVARRLRSASLRQTLPMWCQSSIENDG